MGLTYALCRVCRRRLRAHLLRRCAAGGVRFRAGELVRLEPNEAGDTAALALADGSIVRTRYALGFRFANPDRQAGLKQKRSREAEQRASLTGLHEKHCWLNQQPGVAFRFSPVGAHSQPVVAGSMLTWCASRTRAF